MALFCMASIWSACVLVIKVIMDESYKEDEQELVCDLSNGAIFSDLERS